jgi:hypothetical protein
MVRVLPAHLHDYHCFSVLATLHKPYFYHKANADPLWQKSMFDELDALSKTHTLDLVDLPLRKFAAGYKWDYKIRLMQMDLWNAIRLILLQKALLKSMVLTMRRLLLLLLDWPLLDPYLQLLLFVIGSYFKWMLKTPSSMVILQKKSICTLHLAITIRHTKYANFVWTLWSQAGSLCLVCQV